MPITVSGTLTEVLCFLLKWKDPFLEIIKQLFFKKIYFNLSLNFVIRSSQSESQLAPSVFAECIELLHRCKEYNKPDFGIEKKK